MRVLVMESRGYALVLVCGLFIAVVALLAEHRLYEFRLSSCGALSLVAPLHVGSSWTRD